MKLRFYTYDLKFRHPFSIAAGKRDFTPVVYLELEFENHTGYGEAALPPYLPETQESVINFFSRLNLKKSKPSIEKEKILEYVF